MLISGAINKYVYITLNRTFTNDYFLKYSAIERVEKVADIDHAIIREAFALHSVEPAIEMVSVADIPAGTGLGSSGSFTVGLLRAIYAFRRRHTTTSNLAEEACHIEIDRLKEPVGKQDQFIAAFGGLTCFEFTTEGQVHVTPLLVSNETLRDLEENLLMFFTGYSRNAHEVLAEQKLRSEQGDEAMIENLHFVKELGLRSKHALESGDLVAFASIMNEHWQYKRRRSQTVSNDKIDRSYQVGMDHGALGGKLVGAGAGGFLLFYTKSQDELRGAMAREGLIEVPFGFDHDGSVVLVRD
jgi:D-glycero-alpha-D-manno-heptose-7-phosphate kinase